MPYFLIVIFSLIAVSCQVVDEYRDHQSIQWNIAAVEQAPLSMTGLVEWQFELFLTPSKMVLQTLLNDLKSAQKTIYLEVYILSHKDIIRELIAAKKRWVDVRILLEPHPFGSPRMNGSVEKQLKTAGVIVGRTSDKNFVFSHGKFILIDNALWLSTGNFSHSSFATNREFLVKTQEASIVSEMYTLWQSDADHRSGFLRDPRMMLAPIDARRKWEFLLQSATGSIIGWMQSFSDPSLQELLASEIISGTQAWLCLGDTKKVPGNLDDVLYLRSIGAQVQTPRKPYTHAKALLIDGRYLVVSSTNFTANSLDNNREVGVVLDIGSRRSRELIELHRNECGWVSFKN